MGVLQKISLQLCQWLAQWSVLHRYLSIICYDDVIFNFYYFIAVPIGKTCSMSLMRFNNRTFYIFKQVFTMFQNFNVYHWNRFLTNIVNKAYTGFSTLTIVSGKKTEISVEKNFRSIVFLFTSKNVASGYTLCHLEICFFLLYVCFKIVTRKSVISPMGKLKYRKKHRSEYWRSKKWN